MVPTGKSCFKSCSQKSQAETEFIYQAVNIDLPAWKSVSRKTIPDKWSRSQSILRWRKTKRKFIDLQILSRRDTKEALLRQGNLDNRKPRQSNWGLQEDKAEKALATKEPTWALSRKPMWFPPTSTRQGWPLTIHIQHNTGNSTHCD